MATIREAIPDDIDNFLSLAFDFYHEQGNFKHTNFDAAQVGSSFLRYVNSQNKAVFLAIIDSAPVGFLMVYSTQNLWGLDKEAHDGAFCVSMHARGRGCASLLMTKYKEWARSQGAIPHVTVRADIDHEATKGMLEKNGFELLGFTMRKIL